MLLIELVVGGTRSSGFTPFSRPDLGGLNLYRHEIMWKDHKSSKVIHAIDSRIPYVEDIIRSDVDLGSNDEIFLEIRDKQPSASNNKISLGDYEIACFDDRFIALAKANVEYCELTKSKGEYKVKPDGGKFHFYVGKYADFNDLFKRLKAADEFFKKFAEAQEDWMGKGFRADTAYHYLIKDVFLTYSLTDVSEPTFNEIPLVQYISESNINADNYWTGNVSEVLRAIFAYHEQFLGQLSDDQIEKIKKACEWLINMQTPTGSFYIKKGYAMRVYEETDPFEARPDDIRLPTLLGNSLVSISVDKPNLKTLRRGYEPIAAVDHYFCVNWSSVNGDTLTTCELTHNSNAEFEYSGPSYYDSIDSDQDSLVGLRKTTFTDVPFICEEKIVVEKGEHWVREEIGIKAAEKSVIDSLSIVLDFLDAENIPGQSYHPPYIGDKRLIWLPGMKGALDARDYSDGSGVVLLSNSSKHPELRDVYQSYIDNNGLFLFFAHDRAVLAYSPSKNHKVADEIIISLNDSELDSDNNIEINKIEMKYKINKKLNKGESYVIDPVFLTAIWADMNIDADNDSIPDELEILAPEVIRSIGKRKHISFQTDYAQPAPTLAFFEASRFFKNIGDIKFSQKCQLAALKGAQHCWYAYSEPFRHGHWKKLFGGDKQFLITDYMVSSASMRFYGYHVSVFKEASELFAFDDPMRKEWRERMYFVADNICKLQINDNTWAQYGGFYQHEGVSNILLDDQGTKLWALRNAYDMATADKDAERAFDYRYTTELFLNNWPILDLNNGHHITGYAFEPGTGRTVRGGYAHQITSYGQANFLIGLSSWADLSPKANDLFQKGMKCFTTVHHTRNPFIINGFVQYLANPAINENPVDKKRLPEFEVSGAMITTELPLNSNGYREYDYQIETKPGGRLFFKYPSPVKGDSLAFKISDSPSSSFMIELSSGKNLIDTIEVKPQDIVCGWIVKGAGKSRKEAQVKISLRFASTEKLKITLPEYMTRNAISDLSTANTETTPAVVLAGLSMRKKKAAKLHRVKDTFSWGDIRSFAWEKDGNIYYTLKTSCNDNNGWGITDLYQLPIEKQIDNLAVSFAVKGLPSLNKKISNRKTFAILEKEQHEKGKGEVILSDYYIPGKRLGEMSFEIPLSHIKRSFKDMQHGDKVRFVLIGLPANEVFEISTPHFKQSLATQSITQK